jgi:hypothetical protein
MPGRCFVLVPPLRSDLVNTSFSHHWCATRVILLNSNGNQDDCDAGKSRIHLGAIFLELSSPAPVANGGRAVSSCRGEIICINLQNIPRKSRKPARNINLNDRFSNPARNLSKVCRVLVNLCLAHVAWKSLKKISSSDWKLVWILFDCLIVWLFVGIWDKGPEWLKRMSRQLFEGKNGRGGQEPVSLL